MPLGLHLPELIIVLAVALLIFGPKKLPEMGSAIGKSIKEFRKGMSELGAPKDEPAEETEESAMSLVEHLEELRWRIFKSLIAITVAAIVAFIFRIQIMRFLTLPLPKTADTLTKGQLVVTAVGEGFTIYLKLAFAVGFVIALPVILYQTWAFISPGLYEREKKNAVPFIMAGIVLFIAGIALGFVVLQYPVQWLLHFASDSFVPLITDDNYYTFVAMFQI